MLFESTLPLRFWSKVYAADCWEWRASRQRNGYGKFTVISQRAWGLPHRLSYQDFCGPIPDGLTLDHLCRNRACVNPLHLEPVTDKENRRRGIKGALTTHCPKGHPYAGANLRIRKCGRRACRQCNRERMSSGRKA